MRGKYVVYVFELFEGPPVVVLWWEDDAEFPPFKASHNTKAINMLGCSKATYYKRMSEATVGEPHPTPIMDREGRQWLVGFNTKETGFKSNIKRLQKKSVVFYCLS